MNNLFNEHYSILQEELQEITNPYERAHVRVMLLEVLAQLEDTTDYVEERTGKDTIKNDNVKPIDFKAVTEPGSEVEEIVDAQEVTPVQEETNTETNNKLEEPVEIDLDHSVKNEPMIVQTEDGEVDITEAYHLLSKFEGSEEDKIELATAIAAYNLTAIYEGLGNLKDCYNKMMLAYYMSDFGLEEINGFLSQLTDGTFNDIYEFINDENLEGFITNLESAIEE